MTTAITSQTFDIFDRNADGLLNEAEMDSFCNATGQNRSLWDANGDRQLARAEFETDLQVQNSVRNHASGNNWTKSDFHAIDADHDGRVTLREWRDYGLDEQLFSANSGPDAIMSHEEWDALVDRINEQKASSSSGGGGKK